MPDLQTFYRRRHYRPHEEEFRWFNRGRFFSPEPYPIIIESPPTNYVVSSPASIGRALFSNGVNSALNFAAGYLTNTQVLIAPIFFAYELFVKKDENTGIDVAEYGLGYLTGKFVPLNRP